MSPLSTLLITLCLASFSNILLPSLAQQSNTFSASASFPTANLSAQYGPPNPKTPPNFEYTFELHFEGGRCTQDQQEKLRVVLNNVAGVADRGKLWMDDALHSWERDVMNWMGSRAGAFEKAIHHNFLRLSAAVKPMNRKDGNGNFFNNGADGWINTYLYVGCDYDWGFGDPSYRCSNNRGIGYRGHYGYFNKWDNIYWNICPDFWKMKTLVRQIRDTANDPLKDSHIMDNYWKTPEIHAAGCLLLIRSIGIPQMNLDPSFRLAAPLAVWNEAKETGRKRGTAFLGTAPVAYWFAALSIAVPEAFNWRAWPLRPSPNPSSDATIFNNESFPTDGQVTIETKDDRDLSGAPQPFAPPNLDTADVVFESLIDNVHNATVECYAAASTAGCDCGPRKGSLLSGSGQSSCLVDATTVTMHQWDEIKVTGTTTLPPASYFMDEDFPRPSMTVNPPSLSWKAEQNLYPPPSKPPESSASSVAPATCKWELWEENDAGKGIVCRCSDGKTTDWQGLGTGQKCDGKEFIPTDDCKTFAIQPSFPSNPNGNKFAGCACRFGAPYPDDYRTPVHIWQKWDTGDNRKCIGKNMKSPTCVVPKGKWDGTGSENLWKKCDCDKTWGFTGEISQYNPCFKRS